MKQEILFVDDEVAIRDLLSRFFRQNGFSTRTASTAQEAEESLAKQTPSLIILDIDLGESDGLTLLETIRAGNPGLPVLMLTGMGFDNELLNEALSKGANGYMSKQLSLDHLLLEVRRVLKVVGSGPVNGSKPDGIIS